MQRQRFIGFLIFGCFAALPALAAPDEATVLLAESAVECRRNELEGPLVAVDILDQLKPILLDEGNYEAGVPYGRYALSQPIHPYGVEVTHLGIYDEWLMAEIPVAERDGLVSRLKLELAPLATEKFWFAGAVGDERGFAGVFYTSSRIVFGLSGSPDTARTALVGCNFLSFSKEQFLEDLGKQRALLEIFSARGIGDSSDAETTNP